jgi:hypothetical protein
MDVGASVEAAKEKRSKIGGVGCSESRNLLELNGLWIWAALNCLASLALGFVGISVCPFVGMEFVRSQSWLEDFVA